MNRKLFLIAILLILNSFNSFAGSDKGGVSSVGGGGGYLQQSIIDLRSEGHSDCQIYHLLGGSSNIADTPDLASELNITRNCLISN